MSLQNSTIQGLNMSRFQSKTETSLYYALSPSSNNKTLKQQQPKNFYIPIGFTKGNSPSSLSGLSGSFSEVASFNKHSSSLKTPVSQKRDSFSPKRSSITKTTLITASQKGWSVKNALTKESSSSRLSPDLETCKKPKDYKRNELKFQPQNSLNLMNTLQKSQQEISSTSIGMTGRNLSPPSMMERLRSEKVNQLKLAQNLIRYKECASEEALSAKSSRSNKMTSDNSLRKYLEKQKGTSKKENMKNNSSSLLYTKNTSLLSNKKPSTSRKIDSERRKLEESDVFENKKEQIREPENKLSILIEDHWRPAKINQEDFPKSSCSIGGDSNQEATPKSGGLYAKVRAVCERNIHLSPKNHEREKMQQVFEFYDKPDIKLISRNVMGRRSGKFTLYKNETQEDLVNQDKTCFPCNANKVFGKTPIFIPKMNKNTISFSAQPQSQPFILIEDNGNADLNEKNTSARFGVNGDSFGNTDLNKKNTQTEPELELELGDFSFQNESEDEDTEKRGSLDSFRDTELLIAKEELEKQSYNNILTSNVEHSFC